MVKPSTNRGACCRDFEVRTADQWFVRSNPSLQSEKPLITHRWFHDDWLAHFNLHKVHKDGLNRYSFHLINKFHILRSFMYVRQPVPLVGIELTSFVLWGTNSIVSPRLRFLIDSIIIISSPFEASSWANSAWCQVYHNVFLPGCEDIVIYARNISHTKFVDHSWKII
jgi:hypothetical protein